MNKHIQSKSPSPSTSNPQIATRLLLAVDTHASFYVVARQIDNSAAQLIGRMDPINFVHYAQKQKAMAAQMYVLYEAGPLGFVLARQLIQAGIPCIVTAPKKLDPYCKRVRTDKTDVRELLNDLDRYLSGNARALRPVRIPTVEQELARAQSRQRDALRRDMQRLAARGRMLLLEFGRRVSNHWWKDANYTAAVRGLDASLQAMLARYREGIQALGKLVDPLEKELVKAAPQPLPVGMGKLTFVLLLREVLGWERFKHRRQVGGFTGLCGGVLQSGDHRMDLAITKAGHKRMRTLLIELAWRMLIHQPNCPLIKKWSGRLAACGTNRSRRKQVIVALARHLAVDIWKWQTGRTSAQALGWKMTKA